MEGLLSLFAGINVVDALCLLGATIYLQTKGKVYMGCWCFVCMFGIFTRGFLPDTLFYCHTGFVLSICAGWGQGSIQENTVPVCVAAVGDVVVIHSVVQQILQRDEAACL